MSNERPESHSEKPLPALGPQSAAEFSEKPLPPIGEREPETEEQERESEGLAVASQIMELQQRGHKGANWFFWVAALSVVNSISVHGGMSGYFVVGLGITLIVDGLAKVLGEQNPDFDIGLKVFAIGFAVAAALVVTAFGLLARRGALIFFAIGMFLYLLDGLLFLLVQGLMSVAFHAFALFWMWSGFSAFRQINAIQATLVEDAD
ncbi:MAG: hypothetical protein HYX68_06925 [Planctomycetes bacterium]|nr:hypothetical protein [Planctomycetota bacterium]